MPKVIVEHHRPNSISYRFQEAELHILVALRRMLISAVHSLAFEHSLIEITTNRTVLQSVVLQDAISQLPLKTSEETLNKLISSPCHCGLSKACPDCSFAFELGVINDTDDVQLVTSDFFRSVDITSATSSTLQNISECFVSSSSSSSSHVEILPDITIVKLNPRQSLHVKAFAKVGCGAINARFNPTSVVGLEPDWKVEISPHEPDDVRLVDLAKNCPQKVFGYQDGQLRVVNERQCNGCHECRVNAEKLNYPNLLKVTAPHGCHRMLIESVGTRECRHLVYEAATLLINKLKEIRACIQTIADEDKAK